MITNQMIPNQLSTDRLDSGIGSEIWKLFDVVHYEVIPESVRLGRENVLYM